MFESALEAFNAYLAITETLGFIAAPFVILGLLTMVEM